MESDGTERSARVVNIGLDLVTARGYAGTTLRDVAAAVGFSKAALYHHFPTKKALLDEMLAPLLIGFDALVDAPAAERLEDDRALLLSEMLDLILAHRREAAVLFGDREVRNLEPAKRWSAQQRVLIHRLTGPRAPVMTQIRARCALALVMQPATTLYATSGQLLRAPLLQIAIETCTGTPGSPVGGSATVTGRGGGASDSYG